MSEDSIEELESQYHQAQRRAAEAQGALVSARRRLSEARRDKALSDFAAKGIKPGGKVRVTSKRFGERKVETVGFGGVSISRYTGIETHFVALKKDGTVGKRKVYLGQIVNVEPAEQ